MKFTKLTAGLILATASMTANADIIDFKAMGNANERGYAVLSTADFDITGRVDPAGTPAYAYLDGAWGGLGVCKVLDANNQCTPSNDDNVTGDVNGTEVLNFLATSHVNVTSIWFNNNHDGDQSLLGDTININGTNNTFAAADQTNVSGSRSDWLWTGFINLDAGDNMDISFVDEEFYITKIEYTYRDHNRPNPEPAVLGMLALGLIGFGAAAKRKKA